MPFLGRASMRAVECKAEADSKGIRHSTLDNGNMVGVAMEETE